MKISKIYSVICSVLFMWVFTMSPALAGAPGTDEEPAPRVFSGTIEISSTQIAFIASAQSGSGTLEFEGMEHDFGVKEALDTLRGEVSQSTMLGGRYV